MTEFAWKWKKSRIITENCTKTVSQDYYKRESFKDIAKSLDTMDIR